MGNRSLSLDVIRTIAIVFVVVNHSIEMIFPFGYKGNDIFCNMSFVYQIFQFIMFTLGRLGVPMFFMLTGFLLVSRKYDSRDKIVHFYKKNFVVLLIIWYFWIVLYNFYFLFFEQKPIIIRDIIGEFLLFKKVPLMHTWYMKEIIIIYAFLPFLSNVVKRSGHIIAIVFVIFLINIINKVYIGNGWVEFLSTRLIYVAYVLMGYYYSITPNKVRNRLYLCLIMIGFALLVIWQIYQYHIDNPQNVWYTNPILFTITALLFPVLKDYAWKEKTRYYVERVSRLSFGVYLLHVPIMQIILRLFPLLCDISIVNVLVLFLLSFFICIIIICLVIRIPKIGKWMFYVK